MKANLVCMGGGVKGIALVGAICYLEEQGYEWEYIAGTSVGAITTSLVAVGYTGKELKDILSKVDYNLFNDKDFIQSIPLVGEIIGFLKDKAVCSGNYIEKFLGELFKAKGKVKFKDISENGVCKLKILATDIMKKELVILPDDLVNYNIDPMEFEIAKAVRMSCSIPFYYKPVRLKCDGGATYIVDGVLMSNFPIWIFNNKNTKNIPTVGLKLQKSSDGKKCVKRLSMISYIIKIIETMLSENEENYICDKKYVKTIEIPTMGICATDFTLTDKEMKALYESGYNTAKQFIHTDEFRHYIDKFNSHC